MITLSHVRIFLLTMIGAMVVTPSKAADPAPDRDELLRTFLSEFVEIHPCKGRFPAEFTFGAPSADEPQVATLTQPFSIARYEVPQNLYAAVMGKNPSRWKGPRNSVEMMSWKDAVEFCRRTTVLLRERELIGADDVIRLPSEAEWEYCCRAGTTTRYSFGDEIRRADDPPQRNSVLDEYAWYTGNAAGNDPPVGALKPNAWGLYDVHGYLWEFTADRWSPKPRTDGANSLSAQPIEPLGADTEIVLRGGSWKDAAEQLTSSSRRAFSVTAGDDAVGVR